MMNKVQFERMLNALIGAYYEDGHTEKEIRDCFEEAITNQTKKAEGDNASNKVWPERVVNPGMEAYVEKAFQAMRKVGKEPRKELMALPLRIMYQLHNGEYDGYLTFIEDIAYSLCGVKEYQYAELKIVGRDFTKLYSGIRYLLTAYADEWDGYRQGSVSATWYHTNTNFRFKALCAVAEKLYKEVESH